MFNNTDGSLDTNAELSEVFNLPANVKVVDDVNFCGGTFNTSYIGCGQLPGDPFITERFTANQEGILWAHEFGHNCGLSHRNTSTNNVMYYSIGTNRLRVNQTECNEYRDSSAAVAGMSAAELPQGSETMPASSDIMPGDSNIMPGSDGMMPGSSEGMPENDVMPNESDETMPSAGKGMMTSETDTTAPVPVKEFVSQIYFDGLPLYQAAAYGEEMSIL